MSTETENVIVVRFLKNDLPYLRGELAGFPPHVAKKLIDRGFAEKHSDGKPRAEGRRVPEPLGSGFLTPPGV